MSVETAGLYRTGSGATSRRRRQLQRGHDRRDDAAAGNRGGKMSDFAGSEGRGLGLSTARDAAAPTEPGSRRKVKVRPLLALMPYVTRYRGHIAAACAALVVASLATLAVPVAVRRMI